MDGSSSVVVGELAAGALIGRHRAIDAQMLLVVAGQVVVTGDADTIELARGQVVLFDGGEEHETRAITAATLVMFERRGS